MKGMDWTEIDNPPPSKGQRQACYRWGLPKKLVKALTPSEASALLGLLGGVADRQAKQWASLGSEQKECPPNNQKREGR